MGKSSSSPPPPPDYVAAAQKQGELNIEAARTAAQLNRVNQVGPYGSISYTQDPNNPDSWTQKTSLDPYQQQLYNLTSQNQIDRQGQVSGAADRWGQMAGQGFDFSQLPQQVSSVAGSDFSGLPSLSTDFSGDRQKVEDAIYGRGARRLDERFGRDSSQLQADLLAKGVREGMPGWSDTMNQFGDVQNDAYTGLQESAIIGGGQEQSRQFADLLRARQQGVGEQLSQFDQRFANAGLTNQARGQGIYEQMMPRQMAYNELQGLYGNEVNAPQAPIAQVAGPQAADYSGAIDRGYGAQVDMYNADQAKQANFLQSLYGLGGQLGSAALMASDRRLKRDIERIGELPNGIPTYKFRFRDEGQERLGVMSDEVREIMPEAVHVGDDGFDRVDYAMIGGKHLLTAH